MSKGEHYLECIEYYIYTYIYSCYIPYVHMQQTVVHHIGGITHIVSEGGCLIIYYYCVSILINLNCRVPGNLCSYYLHRH